MLLTAALVILSILIVWDYVKKRTRYRLTANIPGPRVYPVLGNIFKFKQKNTEDVINIMVQQLSQYGSTVKTWALNQLMIISSDLELVEVLLSSPKYIRKSSFYEILNIWLGGGLLISNGRKWFQRRKIITPTFHFKILEEFAEIFDEHGTILMQKLKEHAHGMPFNIQPRLTLAALDIVSETAMGTKIEAQTNPDCEYAKAVHEMSDILMTRLVKIHLTNDFIFKLAAPDMYARQEHAKRVLHDFTENIIEERRRSLLDKKLNDNFEEVDDFGRKRKMAFLDVLLQASVDGRPLTNDDIREEVDTFMFEGHDTTTGAIGFTLFCISRHPEVQRKLFEEIRAVIGDDKTTPVGFRELNELKYLELVIKESLRLFPPVPLIARRLEENIKINGGKSTIPANSEVVIPIFTMLKNPEIFPDPEKFIPERHVNTEKANPYLYIPFSAGPRNCIGQKFALVEMKSLITKFLRYYELLPMGPAPKTVLNVILRSKNGVHLGLRPRVYE